MKIKNVDLLSQYKNIKEEINAAIFNTIENSSFIMGQEVNLFENNIAKYLNLNKNQIISCASGSDALLLALMTIDLKKDDEVITTPFTFIATASCVARVGAKIIFIDINEQFNIDVNLLEKNITPKTKAVISVDLYGNPCDQHKIKSICDKHKIIYISDSSQSIGSSIGQTKIGCIADFTTFSFFPSKNLGCYGDGGMVISLNEKNAEKIRRLRCHGSNKNEKYEYDYIGINSRLDTMQASILNVKLKYLDKWIKQRRENALKYTNNLTKKITCPQFEGGHVYNQYTILSNNRADLKKYLEINEIPSMVYYPKPLHLQKCFKYLGYKKGDLPKSELYADLVLSIPVHESLNEEHVQFIINKINLYEK